MSKIFTFRPDIRAARQKSRSDKGILLGTVLPLAPTAKLLGSLEHQVPKHLPVPKQPRVLKRWECPWTITVGKVDYFDSRILRGMPEIKQAMSIWLKKYVSTRRVGIQDAVDIKETWVCFPHDVNDVHPPEVFRGFIIKGIIKDLEKNFSAFSEMAAQIALHLRQTKAHVWAGDKEGFAEINPIHMIR